MRTTLFFLLFILFTCSRLSAQTVHSTCTAHDTIQAKYRKDAQILALSRIYRIQSTYIDSTIIPEQLIDTIMRAILAVYNCPLRERDTIIGSIDIHTRPDSIGYWPDVLSMSVDTNYQWVKDIANNVRPNSNPIIENLLTKYYFNNQYFLAISGIGYIDFVSDSAFNMNAVGKEFLAVNGTYTAEGSNFVVGDGDKMSIDTITNAYTIINFWHGWGDCPAGCICHIEWKFKVYSNCDVEYISRKSNCYLGILEEKLKNKLTVSPNPFTDQIKVKTTEQNVRYCLYNMMGNKIKEGVLNPSDNIYAGDIPTGSYLLHLTTKDATQSIRLLKQ